MVPGFNTDFKYRGETYHVQTEDNGVGNPVVVTLLYHKGAILASRRTPYHNLVATPGFEPELKDLMKNQHKELMRSLLAGDFDKDGTAPAVTGGSGEHPAEAAAAIAGSVATPTPALPLAAPSIDLKPSLRVNPSPRPAPVATLKPPLGQTPGADLRSIPHAVAPRAETPVSQPTTLTLDDAIRAYLMKFAATAAGTAH